MKFLARDNETGRIGTYQTTFVIPNLNKEEKRIPISAVVLSSQREDLNNAIYDAVKAKDRAKENAVDPLVQDGKRLLPSVTRVFGTGHQIYVYFQVYKQQTQVSTSQTETPPQHPLVAYITLFQGSKKAYETPPKSIIPNPRKPAGYDAAQLRFERRQFAARRIRLPGHRPRSLDPEGSFLASADYACAVARCGSKNPVILG